MNAGEFPTDRFGQGRSMGIQRLVPRKRAGVRGAGSSTHQIEGLAQNRTGRVEGDGLRHGRASRECRLQQGEFVGARMAQ